MGFRGRFRHEVLSHPRWRKWFSVRKFLRRHFEMTVIYHIETNTELRRSFQKDSHRSSQKDWQTIFQPGSCRLNLVRIQSVSTRNTPKACKRQFAFEISFRRDSHRAFQKDWGRCRLFRRDSHISFQREHHFKITHFEGIIIYHFLWIVRRA